MVGRFQLEWVGDFKPGTGQGDFFFLLGLSFKVGRNF